MELEDKYAYPEYQCSDCKETRKNSYFAADFLTGIVKQLYASDKLDIQLLENDLEELCSYLGVNIPLVDIQIRRKD